MDNNLWTLLKIRFISQLKLNMFSLKKGEKETKKQLAITLAVGLVILIGGIYSGTIAYGLELLNLGHLIPSYGFILASIISLFFTVFKANGELFGFKDYETLMSLPIKTSTVIASRFMYLYIWNTLFSIIIMIPMGTIYAVYERPSFMFYLLWIFSIFFISMIPTTIATVIGALITAIASKSRHSIMISTILTIFLVIFLFAGSMIFGGLDQTINFNQLEKIYELVLNKVFVIYPIAKLYHHALIDGNILSFILFIGLSVGWYYLFIKVLSLKYKTINTGLTSFKHQNNYEIQHLKSSNALAALYKKELKRLLSSTVYATNTGMGLILAVIVAIAIMFVGVDRLVNMIGIQQVGTIIPKVAPFLLAALVAMSCTSCVSLSLEGKNVWIIRSLPVTLEDVYLSKVLVNLTFTIPVSLICGSLFAIGTKADLYETFMMIAIPCIFALFTAVWGIFINYKFVNYDWETETQVVKQSVSAIIGMIGGLFLAVILGLPTIFLSSIFYLSYCLIVVSFLLCLSGVLYRAQIKKAI